MRRRHAGGARLAEPSGRGYQFHDPAVCLHAGTSPYPPNLAFADHPQAAAASACSIVHDVDDRDRASVPDDATERMWRRQHLAYRTRQIRS
jgi:hypothetical protein